MSSGIDYVILWVDGDDSNWIESYNFHKKNIFSNPSPIEKYRYRDMDILKYVFRSFEKFSPWVDNIYFVTCGQKPNWLNEFSSKIKLVNHEDFIPKEFLPTFNSTTIEMFIHLIPGLSDKFVFFNDDMLINSEVKPDFFFKNDKPCDTFSLHPNIENNIASYPYGSILHTAITLCNSVYSPKVFLKNNFFKLFNLKYGLSSNFKNALCIPWWGFSGFVNYHGPQAYTKSTFQKVWHYHSDVLLKSAGSKFRQGDSISQYLFRFSQLLEGDFYPVSQVERSSFYNLSETNLQSALDDISQSRTKMICLNDSERMSNFDHIVDRLSQTLCSKFPHKSKFEL